MFIRLVEKEYAKAMSPMAERMFQILSSSGTPVRLLSKCPFPSYVHKQILYIMMRDTIFKNDK